eukprot:jgi/Galph1/2900/GphlegSOOS_G1553.1
MDWQSSVDSLKTLLSQANDTETYTEEEQKQFLVKCYKELDTFAKKTIPAGDENALEEIFTVTLDVCYRQLFSESLIASSRAMDHLYGALALLVLRHTLTSVEKKGGGLYQVQKTTHLLFSRLSQRLVSVLMAQRCPSRSEMGAMYLFLFKCLRTLMTLYRPEETVVCLEKETQQLLLQVFSLLSLCRTCLRQTSLPAEVERKLSRLFRRTNLTKLSPYPTPVKQLMFSTIDFLMKGQVELADSNRATDLLSSLLPADIATRKLIALDAILLVSESFVCEESNSLVVYLVEIFTKYPTYFGRWIRGQCKKLIRQCVVNYFKEHILPILSTWLVKEKSVAMSELPNLLEMFQEVNIEEECFYLWNQCYISNVESDNLQISVRAMCQLCANQLQDPKLLEKLVYGLLEKWNPAPGTFPLSRQGKLTILQCLQELSISGHVSDTLAATLCQQLIDSLQQNRQANPQIQSAICECLSNWLPKHEISQVLCDNLMNWLSNALDPLKKSEELEKGSLWKVLFYGFLSPHSRNFNRLSELNSWSKKLMQQRKKMSLKVESLLQCLVFMGMWFCSAQSSQVIELENWLSSVLELILVASSWQQHSEQLLFYMCEICNYFLSEFSFWKVTSEGVLDSILQLLSRLVVDPCCSHSVIHHITHIIQEWIKQTKISPKNSKEEIILDKFLWCCFERVCKMERHSSYGLIVWQRKTGYKTNRTSLETFFSTSFKDICELVMETRPVSGFFLLLHTDNAVTRVGKWWSRIYHYFLHKMKQHALTQPMEWNKMICEELQSDKGLMNNCRITAICAAHTLSHFTALVPLECQLDWIWKPLNDSCLNVQSLKDITDEQYQILMDHWALADVSTEIANLEQQLASIHQTLSSQRKGLSNPRKKSSQEVSSRDKQQMQAELDRQKSTLERHSQELQTKLENSKLAQQIEKRLIQAEAGLEYIIGLKKYLNVVSFHQEIRYLLDRIQVLIRLGVIRSLVLEMIKVCCYFCDGIIAKNATKVSKAMEECLWKGNKLQLQWVTCFLSDDLCLDGFIIFYPLLVTTLEYHKNDRTLIRTLLESLQIQLERNVSIALYCTEKEQLISLLIGILEMEDSNFDIASGCLGELIEKGFPVLNSKVTILLLGLLSGKETVRGAILDAIARLDVLTQLAQRSITDNVIEKEHELSRFLWLASHDIEEENALAAEHLYKLYGEEASIETDIAEYTTLLSHKQEAVRHAAAFSIAHLFQVAQVNEANNMTQSQYMAKIFSLFVEKHSESSTSKEKNIWNVNDEEKDSQWKGREGIARVLEAMGKYVVVEANELAVVFAFLIARGFGDTHDQVRTRSIQAAIALIESQGAKSISFLLPLVENHLGKKVSNEAKPSKAQLLFFDRTREGLIVSLGTLARYFDPQDSRVISSMECLVNVCLETTSESVQLRVRDCLRFLSSLVREKAIDYGNTLFLEMTQNGKYNRRRGAAYALAGIVKGLGLSCLEEMGILDQLFSNLQQQQPKMDSKAKEGRLLLLETLSKTFQCSLDAYFLETLPFLLSCFGDAVAEVRDTCIRTTKAMMSSISGLAVRLALPSILKGFQDSSWRVKAGSCEMLGMMAYCAPRQLGECLPFVVPKLSDALVNSHPKVVSAAEAALYRIASVTRNPEIRELAPFVLEALREPSKKTTSALDAMMATEFVHHVDAASIALLIPVLHRGLGDRSTEVKKKASIILGSMCSQIASSKDMKPYLEVLLPDLLSVLLDPIPDARAMAARALGSFARGIKSARVGNMAEKLLEMIHSGKSSAERSGAAMGLAQVSSAANAEELDWILKEATEPIRLLSEKSKEQHLLWERNISASQREGCYLAIAALALTLKESFEKYLPWILPLVLQGFADESDIVHEAAIDAGKNIVFVFATQSFELLISVFSQGLKHNNWRIRQASVQLFGDMLYGILGHETLHKSIFGNFKSDDNVGETEEEEDSLDEHRKITKLQERAEIASFMTVENEKKSLEKLEQVIGKERRQLVLSLLFIVNRGDSNGVVRATASKIWKTLIVNTPKSVRELLPLIIAELIEELSCGSEDLHERACETLADLVKRFGERILPEILPLLEPSIRSSDVVIRRSTSDGLLYLVQNCPRNLFSRYAESLMQLVQITLQDEVSQVKENGAKTFVLLYRVIGDAAIEMVYPILMGEVASETRTSIECFEVLFQHGGHRLAHWVISNILTLAVWETTAPVLACAIRLSQGSIATLTIARIEQFMLESCVHLLFSKDDLIIDKDKESTFVVVVKAVSCFSSYTCAMCDTLRMTLEKEKRMEWRAGCLYLLGLIGGTFIPADEAEDVTFSSMITTIIHHFHAKEKIIIETIVNAVGKIFNEKSTHLLRFISTIRKSLLAITEQSIDKPSQLTTLSYPAALSPLIDLCMEGLLKGQTEWKEESAITLQLIIFYADTKPLSSRVVKVVGPLIRISSERNTSTIRTSILETFYTILQKGCPEIRLFVPQLQSVFLKCLADTQKKIRYVAGKSLGLLVGGFQSIRWDALWNELLNLLSRNVSVEIRLSTLYAMYKILEKAPVQKTLSWNMVETYLFPLLMMKEAIDEHVGNRVAVLVGFWIMNIHRKEPKQFLELLHWLLSTVEGLSGEIPSPLTTSIAEIFKAVVQVEEEQQVVEMSPVKVNLSLFVPILSKLRNILQQLFTSDIIYQRINGYRICLFYLDFLYTLGIEDEMIVTEKKECWKMIARIQKETSEQVRFEFLSTVKWIRNHQILQKLVSLVIQIFKNSSSSKERCALEQSLGKLSLRENILLMPLSEEDKMWLKENAQRLKISASQEEETEDEEIWFGNIS